MSEVTAKIEVSLWSYKTEFETKGSFTYPSTRGKPVAVRAAEVDSAPVLRLLDTGFVEREPYHVFGGGAPSVDRRAMSRGDSGIGSAGVLAGEAPFVSNIFPYAEPALATSDSGAALAYVVYDPELPVT